MPGSASGEERGRWAARWPQQLSEGTWSWAAAERTVQWHCMYELLHLAGSRQCQIVLMSFCKYKDKIKPNLFFQMRNVHFPFFSLMGTSYILFPILFSPLSTTSPLKKKIYIVSLKHNSFKKNTPSNSFEFCTKFWPWDAHTSSSKWTLVLKCTYSLLFPVGMGSYNPQSLCCIFSLVCWGKKTVLITVFVGRFWQSKSCSAITNIHSKLRLFL